jgi:beta-N-acetylhexosaminidase
MNNLVKNIGQNLILGFEGVKPSEKFLKFLKTYNIGGVIIFKKNYSDLKTLINTINTIQESLNFNAFISIDHEGGRVQRLDLPFTKLPSFRQQVKEKTQTQIFNNTSLIAQELKIAGFNINFSPVCDMIEDESGAIGDRSVGNNLEETVKAITSTVRGFVKENMVSCAKHFPGHGVIKDDTHLDMFYSDKTIDELKKNELIPFKKAIKSKVTFIMMSHIVFNNIEKVPASFSKKLINYIRNDLRFNRLIISDDISMGAISKHYSLKESIKNSILAGCDIIINSKVDIDKLRKTLDELIKENENNLPFIKNLEKSYERISLIKNTFINKNKINYEKANNFLKQSPLKNIFKN